jgi:hypothetical protein
MYDCFLTINKTCYPNEENKKMTRESSRVHGGEGICLALEMGEEKPEEELMGKRKSSPRLDRP